MPRIRDRDAYCPPPSTRDKKKRQTRFIHEETGGLTLSQIKEAVNQFKNASLLPKGYTDYVTYDDFAAEKLNEAFEKAITTVGYSMAKSLDDIILSSVKITYQDAFGNEVEL